MADAAATFDRRVDVYDALVDWPRRLQNEAPFFRDLFATAGVRRVLDLACGTGRHAAMFHDWGLVVTGADISPAMIARCRERFGESDTLRWEVRSFEQPCPTPAAFDAVVCVGNSLALAADLAGVEQAVRAMLAALCPGGLGIIQVLNLYRLAEGPTQWQHVRRLADEAQPRILLKGLHRCGPRGYIDLVEISLDDAAAPPHFDSPTFLGLESHDLVAMLARAGARDVRTGGSYQREPFHRTGSQDLIVVYRAGRPSPPEASRP